MQTVSSVVDALVGIPYRAGEAGPAGCDCWGLVVLWFRCAHVVELPAYRVPRPSTADRAAIAAVIAGEIGPPWRPVTGPLRLSDVALLRRGSAECHVGVHVGAGRLLHAEGPGPSVVERLSSPGICRRIVGWWRHEALA